MARNSNQPRLGPVVYNSMANTGFGRSRFLTPTGALKNARPLNGVSE